MKAAPVAATVRVGSLRLDVRKYADGRFGFDYTPPGEMRVKVRVHDLGNAEGRAREILGGAHGGRVERLAIDESEYAEFLMWKAGKRAPAMIPELAEKFVATKESRGRSAKHVRDIKDALASFARVFTKSIHELTSTEVEKWLDDRKVGPRRWNNLLSHIVSLVRFARRERLISAELTPVETIERHDVTVTVLTYTPAEVREILRHTPHDWTPAIVLSAFCGLRPEEVAPENTTKKLGLRWESILWDKRKVDVPASVSKTRQRRFAPLTDAALAFLDPFRKKRGAVAPVGRMVNRKLQWFRNTDVVWKPDALRHSFASYRLALVPDVGALALEMGNSPTMIFRHYLDLKHKDEAEEYFAIRP